MEENISKLPEPVRRYMRYTGVVGSPWVETVHLKQVGKFRQGIDRPWMSFSADEFYTINPPGFRWDARIKMMGLPLLRVIDKYESGKGSMAGKLAGLISIFDVQGEELNQASMLRYINEMIWFPTAFLGDNVTWESMDNQTARVRFTDHGAEVAAIMYFDDQGRLTNFTADRYREIDGTFSLDLWSTPISTYGARAGLQLPVAGSAVWHLPEGDLSYIELEITEIVYNLVTN
jgi:hypothetical protein